MTVTFSNITTINYILSKKRTQLHLTEISMLNDIKEMLEFSYAGHIQITYHEMRLIKKYND